MDQVDIIGKLSDLSSRIETKEKFAEEYKKLVKARLATISDKIKKLLVRQKEMVMKIKEDSKKELTALGKKLGDMKTEVKKQGDDALKDAQGTTDEMKKNLDQASGDIEKLKEQLRQPNPDLENMKTLVESLQSQLKDSTNQQDEYELNLRELRSQLQLKDTTIEQLTSGMTDAINMITDLITKVEKMSINNDDIQELTKLLDETEKQLDVSDDTNNAGTGSEDGGLGIANLFGQTETDASLPTPPPAPTVSEENTNKITPMKEETEIVEIEPTIDDSIWKDVEGEANGPTQGISIPPSSPTQKNRSRKARQELSSAVNREKYSKELDAMTKAAGVGGRTRRRRKKARSIKRGGYVVSKKNSSRKRKDKKRKTNASGSKTSSGRRKSSSS